jgi:hypothetical protein
MKGSGLLRGGFETIGDVFLLVWHRTFAVAGVQKERDEHQGDDQQGDPGDPIDRPQESGTAPRALSGMRMVPVAAGFTDFILLWFHRPSLIGVRVGELPL